MRNTNITLSFSDSEVKSLEEVLMKYFNRKTKPKTKKETKRLLEMFASSMFNKGVWAIEHKEEYINTYE